MTAGYFKYWGKARQGDDLSGPRFHLLPYHCLDVAAVADAWWCQSAPLRRLLSDETGLDEEQTKALMLFFVALHDLGKLDIRFQLKASGVLSACWPEYTEGDADADNNYFHGPAGFYVFRKQIQNHFALHFDSIAPWLQAVCGHHGDMQFHGLWRKPDAEKWVIDHDSVARHQWFQWLSDFFLGYTNIDLRNPLPPAPPLLAGFCSVSDWIGSNSLFFQYQSEVTSLGNYWKNAKAIAAPLIEKMGLHRSLASQTGMSGIFPGYKPRQLQTLVDHLPLKAGLTIVEAPTGSGKTEAAIAYASRLLDASMADSIIFALPTQATANAMLVRLEEAATRLFEQGANLVLAHGKERFNSDFDRIKLAAKNNDIQTNEQERAAQVQCAQWLGESRKRVFLGQIGVCTIDQVLISALPVRHNFVRQFGIQKSVLIVDEVHAYDAYMYGLLTVVLRRQHQAGGSAVLLSATLPQKQKLHLLSSYGDIDQCHSPEYQQPYPLISFIDGQGPAQFYSLNEVEQPPERNVTIEQVMTSDILPDEHLIDRIVVAAGQGALVGIVCNLVADAQQLLHQITKHCKTYKLDIPVDLFHARFRFEDRQNHELRVVKNYGKNATRMRGRILVATQVIEQSLDLDFDWLITQICPVDLLFQRLGRLHRHPRKNRPSTFCEPNVVVLVPKAIDFGLHEYVYATSRFLWRTQELLVCGHICFPAAYRDWIEKVYEDNPWPDEPEEVTKSHDEYWAKCRASGQFANQISNTDYKPFAGTEGQVALMTRDGDMNLNLLLVQDAPGTVLLNGDKLEEMEDWQYFETLQLNTVSVPASWKGILLQEDKDDLIKLPMQKINGQWQWQRGKTQLTYNPDRGLERTNH